MASRQSLSVPTRPTTAPPAHRAARRTATRLRISGVVQGVGFRPFVYRLARDLGIDGSVRNVGGVVEADVAGSTATIGRLVERLRSEAPPRAEIQGITSESLPRHDWPAAGSGFVVAPSASDSVPERRFPPDVATCDDCLQELFDPADRRYRYPFINCTNCGPRATIIDDLPYDRARTSMRAFRLCGACRAEYADPANRRFHAEPVACPSCGPQVLYRTDAASPVLARGEPALGAACHDLAGGKIVAVKGLGGYHLACDATDSASVTRLRERKRRWAKPFAVMVRDLAAARALAHVNDAEAALLSGPERPIVLLRPREDAWPRLAPEVLDFHRWVGLFLPYTPLHHLLLAVLDRPIVLTSGNRSDEPIVLDDDEALRRLGDIADSFLQHDRGIDARYDDSVARIVEGRPTLVRRARGFAPQPLRLPHASPRPLAAFGAELKHTFALAQADLAHVGPHTGDLEDLDTFAAFTHNLQHLQRLLAVEPEVVAHDLHPGYLSTQHAAASFPADRRLGVQHHHAHVASCGAEHGLAGPFIGVAYDGLGLGDDGTFWGGEVLLADYAGYRRFARFSHAPMPGGAAAIHRPYRMALGYLFGAEALPGAESNPDLAQRAAGLFERLDAREVEVVRTQVARGLNSPVASSAGRLFDAASSLLGIRDVARYEGEAAVALEMAADEQEHGLLPYALVRQDGLLVYDARPTLAALLDGAVKEDVPRLAARFQRTIVEVTRELCQGARQASGLRTVCLSGGVFQNVCLSTQLRQALAADGFEVYANERVPTNDGGISYGQAAVAAARLAGV